MAALRVATVSTVALTTVGSIVGYGGLGNLLLRGVDTQFKAQILTASVLCVVLAVVLDLLPCWRLSERPHRGSGRGDETAMTDAIDFLLDPASWSGADNGAPS
jgi:ABC-type proline/glycine betaine transport system permease subunit